MDEVVKILILALVGGLALVIANLIQEKLSGKMKGTDPFRKI